MLEKLLGVTADENTLFETILFEIESNFDYFNKNGFDIILKSLENRQFQVAQVVNRDDPGQRQLLKSEYWKKKYWFCTVGRGKSISMILCRIDLSTKMARVYQNGKTENCINGAMVDPDKPVKPLTTEEIRLAFQELCGMLQDSTEAKSKPKKAM